MEIKSFFRPQVIKVFRSKFNGEISLIKSTGKLRLEVDGLIQSGEAMIWIWSMAIRNLLPKKFSPKRILLLGLGGGSALFWLRKHFPETELTAVEIDPVMIKIARENFGIGKIKNMEIINADALQFIKEQSGKWGLVLVDCYQGQKIPEHFEEIEVLKSIKKIGDAVLINRLYWDDFKIKTDDFVGKISRYFRIKSVYTGSNLVISLN